MPPSTEHVRLGLAGVSWQCRASQKRPAAQADTLTSQDRCQQTLLCCKHDPGGQQQQPWHKPVHPWSSRLACGLWLLVRCARLEDGVLRASRTQCVCQSHRCDLSRQLFVGAFVRVDTEASRNSERDLSQVSPANVVKYSTGSTWECKKGRSVTPDDSSPGVPTVSHSL